jgi:hypothetical protein
VEDQLPVTTDEVLANGDRLLARSRRLIAELDVLIEAGYDRGDVIDLRD